MHTDPIRVVIVGGVAAGPKTAAKIMRLNPNAQVVLLEKGSYLSYAGCGLPYYVGDWVKEQKQLMDTPTGAVRDAAFFKNVKGFDVRTRTEAVEIDRAGKRVKARRLDSGEEYWLEYDALVLATGASPVVPPIPGIELPNVHTLHKIEDADAVKKIVDGRAAGNAVVIGGGLIGVETAEMLVERGWKVSLVEMLPRILVMLDWEMAKAVEAHMAAKGVRIMTGTQATMIRGEGRAESVETSNGALPADLVVVAVGVRPNVALAKNAGIELGRSGAIQVDQTMRTSDPYVFAAGDCAECRDRITGKGMFVPLGSTANKHGRVAANVIGGIDDAFPGILCSTVCKVFDFCVARTGLGEAAAREQGYDVVTVLVPGPDKPHYMPTVKTLFLKLIVDRPTRRLLGAQAVGPGDGAHRINIAAVAITAGMTVDQVAHLDLVYAPPFTPAIDNLITAANVARNKLDGVVESVSPMDVRERMQSGNGFVFLDVRSPQEVAEVALPNALNIPLGALRARAAELDKSQEIVAFCKVSLRGYEAAMILKGLGFQNVRFMDGGVAMWPYEKA